MLAVAVSFLGRKTKEASRFSDVRKKLKKRGARAEETFCLTRCPTNPDVKAASARQTEEKLENSIEEKTQIKFPFALVCSKRIPSGRQMADGRIRPGCYY